MINQPYTFSCYSPFLIYRLATFDLNSYKWYHNCYKFLNSSNQVIDFSCSYAKICDFIVAQEMPDSLTTMFKTRVIEFILVIDADKMALSLTTTQL